MRRDRDYYRCLTDAELLEELKRGVNVDWEELATVIGERLQDANRYNRYEEY